MRDLDGIRGTVEDVKLRFWFALTIEFYL